VDFLFLLIALFSLGVTAEALRANIDGKSAFSLQHGQFDPKFQVEVVAPTNHSSCHKSRMNGLSCGVRVCVLSQFTHGQTDISLVVKIALYRCSAVKTIASDPL